ncbi:MAG TPA: DUF3105 domain-containing protein [Actinomycetota bacterium]
MAGPRGRPVRSGTRSKADQDAARRRRIERDREEARRRRVRRGLIAIGLVLAVVAFGALDVFLHRLNGEERALLARAPAAAAAAGCGSVQDVPPYPKGLDRTHIGSGEVKTMPPLSTYPTHPPASGPHAPVPLAAGVYTTPPPIDQAIHSLEHSAVIVWFDPSVASSREVKEVERFFAQGGERNHVIVAPYDYPFGGPAGRLPPGKRMALVAWHRVRYCGDPSLPVAFDFVHAYRFDIYQWGAYRGVAPERFAPI